MEHTGPEGAVHMVPLTNTSLQEAKQLTTFKAADIVNLYLPPILIFMGVCLNILSILVMRSHHFRRVSTSLYLTGCAVNDVMGLCFSLLSHWLFVNYPYVYRRGRVGDGLCAFFNFYGYSNTDVTLLLTACMTMDRAYVIQFPLRVAMSTMRRTRCVIAGCVGVVSAKNFYLFFCSAFTPPEGTERMCVLSPSGKTFYYYVMKVTPWINDAFHIVCLVLIFISNVVIIVNVKKSVRMTDTSRRFNHSTHHSDPMRRESGASHSASSSGRLFHMTTMILAQSFATVVLTCPFPLYLSLMPSDVQEDAETLAMHQLLFSLFFYMLYSNKCVNFFLYFISGHKFRLALTQLMHCNHDGAADHSRRGGGRGPHRASVAAIPTPSSGKKSGGGGQGVAGNGARLGARSKGQGSLSTISDGDVGLEIGVEQARKGSGNGEKGDGTDVDSGQGDSVDVDSSAASRLDYF